MARRRDPRSGKLLPEGITPITSKRTGEVTYRARISYGPKRARQHVSKTEKSVDAAIEWRLKTLLDVNLGRAVQPSTITCSEYFESWYSLEERTWSGSRALTVKRSWDTYARPYIGEMRLQRVVRNDIQRIADQMSKRGLASSTVDLYLVGFQDMFSSAVGSGVITENPCSEIVVRPTEKIRLPIWTPLQIQKFFQAESAVKSKHLPLWKFLVGTCCRIGEALALHWVDINFESEVVWFHRTIARNSSGQQELVNRTKSSDEGRTVTLETWVIDAIKDLPRTDDRVFGSLGSITRVASLSQAMRIASKRAGLPPITPHGLRHASATAMAMNGVEESIVQEILGHHSREFTRRIYIHVNTDSKRKGTSSLTRVLGQDISDTTTNPPIATDFEGSASEVRQNEKSENDKTG